MTEDVFPRTNEGFDKAQADFVTAIAANPDAYGLTAADVTALQAAQTIYVEARARGEKSRLQAHVDTQSEHTARETYLSTTLRPLAKKANAHPTVTPSHLKAAALAPHDTVHHVLNAPTTRPIATVTDDGSLHQRISWVDEASPTKRAKPHGVEYCELWLKIGDTAPIDDTTCHLAATDSATPYTYEFAAADLGKTAYWLLRWVSRRGKGPWASVVAARING